MIEKVVLDYLTSCMKCLVAMEKLPGPGPFILIQKVGGSKENQIWTSTLEFTVFDTSLYNAAALCEEMIGYLDAMADHVHGVSRSHYGGSYNATFTSDKTYRYKAIYTITHY